MDVESRIELYQNLYTQEIERRDRIHARLNFPFAILLALSGLVAYIVQNIPVFSSGLAVVFWELFAIAMIAILISFVFLCLYLFKYSDCLVASPEEMDDYYVELEKHHGESNELVDKAFAQYRLDTFKEAGTKTGKSNDQRSENIYRANISIARESPDNSLFIQFSRHAWC
ncbi:hypothetical protein [Shewanella halotolerans]|uniref:hypothetical protein n=1 Tax=Shewanella halotolerans TaxID=2864204 RepID=UPI001C65672F|nr:hypothetical protein [Shewanella halotolerans]QYJ88636.1 hypothetical protein K0H81_12545 [Shewanella halotolerans]